MRFSCSKVASFVRFKHKKPINVVSGFKGDGVTETIWFLLKSQWLKLFKIGCLFTAVYAFNDVNKNLTSGN